MSQIVKTMLTKAMNKHMKFCKFRVIFHANSRLKNYFCLKYFVSETLRSSLIYKFSCGSCTTSCIGTINRNIKVRVSKHQGVVSQRASKPVKGNLSTSVKNHKLVCDHKVSW